MWCLFEFGSLVKCRIWKIGNDRYNRAERVEKLWNWHGRSWKNQKVGSMNGEVSWDLILVIEEEKDDFGKVRREGSLGG